MTPQLFPPGTTREQIQQLLKDELVDEPGDIRRKLLPGFMMLSSREFDEWLERLTEQLRKQGGKVIQYQLRGGAMEARQSHSLEVVGSLPTPATISEQRNINRRKQGGEPWNS